jgi:mannosyltransferase OCH1-like enzyme
VLNHYVLVVFDSCRYDSFTRARPRVIKKLGRVERRWSYASWTSPSHFNLLTGLMPHSSVFTKYSSRFFKLINFNTLFFYIPKNRPLKSRFYKYLLEFSMYAYLTNFY